MRRGLNHTSNNAKAFVSMQLVLYSQSFTLQTTAIIHSASMKTSPLRPKAQRLTLAMMGFPAVVFHRWCVLRLRAHKSLGCGLVKREGEPRGELSWPPLRDDISGISADLLGCSTHWKALIASQRQAEGKSTDVISWSRENQRTLDWSFTYSTSPQELFVIFFYQTISVRPQMLGIWLKRMSRLVGWVT